MADPALWTTHDRWFRGFEDNAEFSKDLHIDGDCLGVAAQNMVPDGKRALNVWILLSSHVTQPLVLVKKDGSVVYNPAQVRGSFVVFDYTCVPHTALPYVHLGGAETPQKRQSVDLRFIGHRFSAAAVAGAFVPSPLPAPTKGDAEVADVSSVGAAAAAAAASIETRVSNRGGVGPGGDGGGSSDDGGRSTPGSDVEGWMADWMDGFDPAAAAASSDDEDGSDTIHSRIRYRPGQ